MNAQLSLANFSMWLRTAPAKDRAEMQAKWQYQQWLAQELALPEAVWLALMVPTDLQEDPNIKDLREKGLEFFKTPEKFINLTDPLAPESALVSLCLVGMLYDLEQNETYLPYDSYQLWLEVANNFGMWRLRYYLEDAVFKNFDAKNYDLFKSVLKEKLVLDEGLIRDITDLVIMASRSVGVKKIEVKNRGKNVYGVYKKVKIKQRNLNEIYDVHGFRLITEKEEDCLKILEAVHRLWRPFPDRLKDYISAPKPNGYQSLHTTVSCLKKHPVEFQIRTYAMDEVAVSGVANHSDYKRNQ